MVSQFNSVMDFGGYRLAFVPGDPPVIAAAAYHRYGLCGYSLTGELLWQRKDLKKVQTITVGRFIGPELQLGVECVSGPYHLVSPWTGVGTYDLSGIGYAYPGDGYFLAKSPRRTDLYRSSADKLEIVWTREHDFRSGFSGPVTAAVTATRFIYSDADGVHCHSLNGTELWSWRLSGEIYTHNIIWDAERQLWRMMEGASHVHFPQNLVAADSAGRVIKRIPIKHVGEKRFLGGGRYMVTSTGRVLESDSGKVVWQFADVD